jgi:hypothetical protein
VFKTTLKPNCFGNLKQAPPLYELHDRRTTAETSVLLLLLMMMMVMNELLR